MKFLEDLDLNKDFPCGSFLLSREEIIDFASKYDPQPFHLNDEAARASFFETICASGLHTQGAAINLLVRSITDVAVIAGHSLHEARFFVPVRPSIRYGVIARWTETTHRDPLKGRAKITGEATLPDGTKVMSFGVTYVVKRRQALLF